MNEGIKYNLVVNYYIDKNEERSAELNFCILENIRNDSFSKIVVVCSEAHYYKLLDICPKEFQDKLIPVVTDVRPSYNDYFALISKLFSGGDNINIVSNLDIIIPSQALICSRSYMEHDRVCLALTRWDVNDGSDYKNKITFFDRPDSQDTWIFAGAVTQINGAIYGLGVGGCDNSISYLLEQNGYKVLNPSRTIKTFHLHLTNIRNYTDVVGNAINRIPPPYKLLEPTF